MAKIPKIILRIETSSAYGRDLLAGIAKYSHLHGPWEFYSESGGEESTLPNLQNWGADGIIARVPDSRKAKKIVAANIPAVVQSITDLVPGVANIRSDGLEIGKMAAEHLLDRGFKQFAYCGFGDTIHWSVGRGRGFSGRIAEAGFETYCYERPRFLVLQHYAKEQELLAKWLKSLPIPVGLMACDDEHGRHVIEACKTADLHVPEQIAIVGVDNDEVVCDLCEPPLSSVAVNTQKAGYETAKLLDKLMAGKKTAKKNIIVRPTHVVTRQSTDILAIEDGEVVKAVRFIRQHAKEMIQVSDVVDAATLSRRALEKRFHRTLGHSIYSEIKRHRLEQITRMLAERDMSISQIAVALGYSGVDKLSRYFRRGKGISPLGYCKKYGRK